MNALAPIAIHEELPAPPEEWLRFLEVMTNGNSRNITDDLHLGQFSISVRRLCDLGLMENPKRFEREKSYAWSAIWKNPHSLRSFLSDPHLQYATFARSMTEYSKDESLVRHVGLPLDSDTVSLSGCLAVAHRAGIAGALSWFAEPRDREKFVWTTEAYHRANGIF
jgi:hypothetical protein